MDAKMKSHVDQLAGEVDSGAEGLLADHSVLHSLLTLFSSLRRFNNF